MLKKMNAFFACQIIPVFKFTILTCGRFTGNIHTNIYYTYTKKKKGSFVFLTLSSREQPHESWGP